MGIGTEPGRVQKDRAGDDTDDFRVIKSPKSRMRHRIAIVKDGFDLPGIALLADEALPRPDGLDFGLHGLNLRHVSGLSQVQGRAVARSASSPYDAGMVRLLASIVLLVLFAAGALAQEPARTDERHLRRKFDPVGSAPIYPIPLPDPVRERPVYMRTAKPLSEIAEFDAKASAACRVHDFGQFEQHRGRAVVAGRTYGAAASGSDLLADHPRVAKPSAVYVFENQGMTACRVWRVKPAALRAAN